MTCFHKILFPKIEKYVWLFLAWATHIIWRGCSCRCCQRIKLQDISVFLFRVGAVCGRVPVLAIVHYPISTHAWDLNKKTTLTLRGSLILFQGGIRLYRTLSAHACITIAARPCPSGVRLNRGQWIHGGKNAFWRDSERVKCEVVVLWRNDGPYTSGSLCWWRSLRPNEIVIAESKWWRARHQGRFSLACKSHGHRIEQIRGLIDENNQENLTWQ